MKQYCYIVPGQQECRKKSLCATAACRLYPARIGLELTSENYNDIAINYKLKMMAYYKK